MTIRRELIDELLNDYATPQDILGGRRAAERADEGGGGALPGKRS